MLITSVLLDYARCGEALEAEFLNCAIGCISQDLVDYAHARGMKV